MYRGGLDFWHISECILLKGKKRNRIQRVEGIGQISWRERAEEMVRRVRMGGDYLNRRVLASLARAESKEDSEQRDQN